MLAWPCLLPAQTKSVPDKLVALTFDDAVKSHYSYVAPLLRQYGFGATFYVCEFPHAPSDDPKYMNWADIKQLSDWGFEIGNHTRHHDHVNSLSEAKLQEEIAYIDAKCDSLHIPKPHSFAYPGYTTAEKAVNILKVMGYHSARTGGEKPYTPGSDDPFYLPSFTPVDDASQAIAAIKQAKDGNAVILTIHGVPDDAHPWVSTSKQTFETYLKYLKDNHYRVISMQELEKYMPVQVAVVKPGSVSKTFWIGPSYPEPPVKRACPIFRRFFKIQKQVKSANLFVTALGLYEASLNGKRIGDAYFTPGFTNYDKRLQFQQYDVKALLKTGNTLDVTIGEGWYRGTFRGAKPNNNYGAEAGLFLELRLVYTDGSKDTIRTDQSWQCAQGPIRYSEFYDGELFDTNYTIKKWLPVKMLDNVQKNLVKTEGTPVRKHETFQPVKIFKTPLGEQVIDFGQNLAGWVKLSVKGNKGDTVRLSHAETLDKEGNFFMGNLRDAKATDSYVLSGGKTDMFEPHFTYHGFRFAKLEWIRNGKAITPSSGSWSAEAVAVYTDLQKTGTFECSDPLLNRLQKNIEWSLNSNFVDIPTDCPQRSERLGWTGDAQVFAATASFLRDTKSFYSKWLKDLASEQGTNGGVSVYVPTVAPYQPMINGAAGWGDAATIIPWTVYQTYADTTVLQNQYASMKGWVYYIQSKSPNGLWKNGGFGDWYAPGPKTDITLIDQCYWAYSTSLLIKAAIVLGKQSDIENYGKILDNIQAMFLKTYVDPAGLLTSDTQTAYVLALQFDMLPDNLRPAAARHLVELIHANNDHLATGFLGTPYLLPVLSRFGYTDVAYRLLNQQSYPSWLYPVKMGATTIWEQWDGRQQDGTVKATSYNHYSYGAVGQWLYENVAGIRAAEPGYRKIIIKPEIGGGLTWAKGSYRSSYGLIRSGWEIKDGKVLLHVEIPPGISAEVYVPGKSPVTAGPGKHTFTGNLLHNH